MYVCTSYTTQYLTLIWDQRVIPIYRGESRPSGCLFSYFFDMYWFEDSSGVFVAPGHPALVWCLRTIAGHLMIQTGRGLDVTIITHTHTRARESEHARTHTQTSAVKCARKKFDDSSLKKLCLDFKFKKIFHNFLTFWYIYLRWFSIQAVRTI